MGAVVVGYRVLFWEGGPGGRIDRRTRVDQIPRPGPRLIPGITAHRGKWTVSDPTTCWKTRANRRLWRVGFVALDRIQRKCSGYFAVWTRNLRRPARYTFVRLALVLLFLPLTTATGSDLTRKIRSAGETTLPAEEAKAEKTEKRVREGTKIETTGYFRSTGDRVTFYSDEGKVRYRGLENLMLERIGRAIEDNPGQLEWSVAGIVTEYRGANFILVMHATLKANAGR
jgi:hypothetical protein